MTRHNRRVLCYRALLFKSGSHTSCKSATANARFIQQRVDWCIEATSRRGSTAYARCAIILEKSQPSWAEIAQACQILREFIKDTTSGFVAFDSNYIQKSSSGSWADDDLKKVLELFAYRTVHVSLAA